MYHGDRLMHQEQELESNAKYSRKPGHPTKSPGCTPTLLSPQVGYEVQMLAHRGYFMRCSPRRVRTMRVLFNLSLEKPPRLHRHVKESTQLL